MGWSGSSCVPSAIRFTVSTNLLWSAMEATRDSYCTPHHHVCGCGNQPPYHCMYCCKDLTNEELLEEFKAYPNDPHVAFDKFRGSS